MGRPSRDGPVFFLRGKRQNVMPGRLAVPSALTACSKRRIQLQRREDRRRHLRRDDGRGVGGGRPRRERDDQRHVAVVGRVAAVLRVLLRAAGVDHARVRLHDDVGRAAERRVAELGRHAPRRTARSRRAPSAQMPGAVQPRFALIVATAAAVWLGSRSQIRPTSSVWIMPVPDRPRAVVEAARGRRELAERAAGVEVAVGLHQRRERVAVLDEQRWIGRRLAVLGRQHDQRRRVQVLGLQLRHHLRRATHRRSSWRRSPPTPGVNAASV